MAALLPYGNASALSAGSVHDAVHRRRAVHSLRRRRRPQRMVGGEREIQRLLPEIVTRFPKYEDALLLDTSGNIVYTANKGVELGSNILNGSLQGRQPHRGLHQGDAVQRDGLRGDHRFRRISAGARPTAWLVSPVGDGRAAPQACWPMQFPISKINRLMTVDKQWEASGMGRTGETYIVGPDGLMRSDSRLFVEDREAFKRAVIDAGTPPEIAEDSLRQNGTTLVQPVDGPSAEQALRGERGTMCPRRLPRAAVAAGVRTGGDRGSALGSDRRDRH